MHSDLSAPQHRTTRRLAGLVTTVTGAVLTAAVATSGVAVLATATTTPTVDATVDTVVGAAAAASTGRSYYVSPDGADSNAGTSPAAPFKTLGRASRQALRPGDSVLLERGAAFRGQTLRVSSDGTAADPITVSSYGSGPLPTVTADDDCVHVTGDHVHVTGIHPTGCTWVGLRLSGEHDLAYGVTASHNEVGIEADPDSNHTRILRNQLLANDKMAPGTDGTNDDYGAHGILVRGDDAEVAWNYIRDSVAVSPDYGTDGTAVEIYGGIGTEVHHNYALDNRAFTELGNSRTRATTYHHNVSISDVDYAEFIVTRGADPTHGGVPGTVIRNNTAKHTGRGSQAFWCGYNCTPDILTMSRNVFWINGRIGWADGTVGGRDNLYANAPLEIPLLPGDVYAAPQFTDFANDDLTLRTSSPAWGWGAYGD